MMRMIVGLMGREAFRSISSSVIPIIDNSTMARSSWFHLNTNTETIFTYTEDKTGCLCKSLCSCKNIITSL